MKAGFGFVGVRPIAVQSQFAFEPTQLGFVIHDAGLRDMVERIAVICGAARCAPHNFVFLEGVKAALTADAAYRDGWFWII